MKQIKSFLLENKSKRQIFFKNSFWLFVGNIISKIIRGILIVVAARILKTEGYGIYSYALSLAGFFTIFSDIGLSYLLTRELSKKKEESVLNPYISTTFYLKIALVLFSIFLTIVFGPYITKIKEAASLMPIVAFLTAFDSLRGFFYSLVRAQNKMEIEARSIIITEVFIGIFTMTALLLNPLVTLVTFTYTFGAALGCILIGWQTKDIWFSALKKSPPQKKLALEILKTAWPFAIMGLLGSFMINIDSLVIGIFRSAHELGIYAAAQKPIQLLYLIPSLFGASFFPTISQLVHENKIKDVERITNMIWRGVLLIAFPMTFGGILLSKWLIETAFSNIYGDASLTFQILLLTLIPVFSGNIFGNVIFALNKQKVFVKATFLGAILNTTLDFVLIPPYGLPGSAVATILSQIATNLYFFIYLRKVIDLKIITMKKIFMSAVLMSLFILILKVLGVNYWIIFGGAIVSYFVFLFLLKEESIQFIPVLNKIKI
jgi:O-antigen/teichoic acid export membrane protein